jgi:hypothetical protein
LGRELQERAAHDTVQTANLKDVGEVSCEMHCNLNIGGLHSMVLDPKFLVADTAPQEPL